MQTCSSSSSSSWIVSVLLLIWIFVFLSVCTLSLLVKGFVWSFNVWLFVVGFCPIFLNWLAAAICALWERSSILASPKTI